MKGVSIDKLFIIVYDNRGRTSTLNTNHSREEVTMSSGSEVLDMRGQKPLKLRFPDLIMYDPSEDLHVKKEGGHHSMAKITILTKEAIMAEAQASLELTGGLPDPTAKSRFKILIPLVKRLSGLWVTPEHMPAEAAPVVPATPEKKPEVTVVVVAPAAASPKEVVPAAAAPVIQEEAPVVKAVPYSWKGFRDKWFPKLAGLILILLALMIAGFCVSVVIDWFRKPVAVQQQMSSGENPVTPMPEIMVTNNSTAPLPVWIDNDTKPRMTLNPGDSLHVKHRNGERTRVKVGETEQIFTFEGMPLVQHMVVDK